MDKFPDDPLEALNFSIDDDEIDLPPKKSLDKEKAATLFGIVDDVKKTEPTPHLGAGGDTGEYTINAPPPRKRGGSGDWLGLRDPSPLDILNDDLVDTPISTKVKPQSAKAPDPPKETATTRAKTAEAGPDTVQKPPTRRRQNILDDLFGESSFAKDKEKPKPTFGAGNDGDRSGTLQKKESKEEFTYLPSMSERRRPGDKKTPTTPKSSDLGDWLQEPKDKPKADIKKDLQRTSTPKSTSSNPTKMAPPRDSGSGLPSWLSSGFNDPPILPDASSSEILAPTLTDSGNQQMLQTTRQEISAEQNVQETSVSASQTTQYQGQQHVQSNPTPVSVVPTMPAQSGYYPVVPPMTGTTNPKIIGQLNDMHSQIGAAMAKHHQNLQSYMQAILFEAQRVGLSDTHAASSDKKIHSDEDESMEDQDGQPEGEEIKKGRKTRSRKDPKAQKIKRLELDIQDMEIQISKLELKVAQLELKNANIEDTKNWEIESLKKTHGFETVAWESRYKRAKENFEEISKEYEEKIVKLKKKIEEIEVQHKERLEALQAERMSDLEKLGEFHRIALEQAASITLPHISGAGPMRLPMKILQKPENETELGEREAALLEKEKQLEILRQSLEMDKSNLDEMREKEKIRKEEWDREIRRTKMEAQLKEEMMTKEYDRKKDQMEALQKQIEKMREDTLKEQAELTREKLELAAEKAKLGAAMSLEKSSESPQLQPLDMMRAKAELEAALEAAREAREAADRERRRHIELRKAVEETEWAQKDKEQELATRERHVSNLLKEIEAKRSEATAALDKAQTLNEEIENKQREIKEQTRQIETKERVLAAERMEIARERVELEKKKTQLEILLPELGPQEDLVVQTARPASSHQDFVDPKALIMRLKAEKDLQQYIVPRRTQSQR